jgi:ATP-dependent Clp protease adaptor protein ClpS
MSTDVIEEVVIDEKIGEVIDVPKRYKVVLINDDQTPMDWVIDVLVSIFKHSETTAKELTLTIHTEGSGIAGIYTFEMAEQKTIEATTASRERGFPLQIKVDEE